MSQQKWTLQALAERVDGRVEGDGGRLVSGVASLSSAGPDKVSFYHSSSYRSVLAQTVAGAVVLSAQDLEQCPVPGIVVDDPRKAFVEIARLLGAQRPAPAPGVDATALVAEQVELDPSASIGPYVVVEQGVRIGPGVELGAGCFIGRGTSIDAATLVSPQVHIGWGCSIGKRGYIHPGVVIGADGFGFHPGEQGWEKVPQLGAVCIGDDVEIGANTTIDRGTLEDTLIGDGVKLDNQVHIGHNCRVGSRTVIAGCTGLSGSVVIGNDCLIAGGCGIADHVELVDGVTLLGMTGVTNSIKEPGTYASLSPLQPQQQWRKSAVRITQLDDIARRLKRLESKVNDAGE